jgi:hypothetical protein
MISYIISGLSYVIGWLIASLHALAAGMIAVVFVSLSAAMPSYNFTPWLTVFNQIDYFFPLSETMVFAVAWFALYVGCFLYRTAKSWIPFVSGS